ncbi:hypothetical protein BASA81_002342 [Batrachochytrium salamandrivorans]|nr:hypothetical protein BASA81_002342 [Batrachochytrium salamandrivorans]
MRTRRKEPKHAGTVEVVRCPFDPFDADTAYKVIRVHVKPGDQVAAGSLLLSLTKSHSKSPATVARTNGEDEDGLEVRVNQIKSTYDGKVTEVFVQDGQEFEAKTQVLLRVEYCLHGVMLPSGLCGACGRMPQGNKRTQLDPSAGGDIVVNVEGGVKLQVSKQEAVEVNRTTVANMFTAKKLSLVLDLDHTLLHCTDDPRAQSFLRRPHVYAFELDGKAMFLKPRPGLHHFLQIMQQHYEMHVYTAGTRPYALKVCSIIDPRGEFFHDRIVSRDDNPELSADDKRISRLFPVDDSMVAIVDDRREVWHKAGSDRNLVTCQAYYYFLGMHEVNNSSDPVNEPPAGQQQQEEESKDVGLAKVEEVLLALHGDFYGEEDGSGLQKQLDGNGKDVKEILKRLHAKVFNHKRVLVFDPELGPETRVETLRALAEESGAVIREQVDLSTTHVISDGGTETCHYARHLPDAAIWVVTPHWLERCSHYWKHVREDSFSLFPVSSSAKRVN